MEQNALPWERPVIKNIMLIFEGTVVKVDTVTRKVGNKNGEEDIQR